MAAALEIIARNCQPKATAKRLPILQGRAPFPGARRHGPGGRLADDRGQRRRGPCLLPTVADRPWPWTRETGFPYRHLLGIEGLSRPDIEALLDLAEAAVDVSRQVEKKKATLRGRTQINLFFEPSTEQSTCGEQMHGAGLVVAYDD